jgi:hypothetical protein
MARARSRMNQRVTIDAIGTGPASDVPIAISGIQT